MNANEFIEIANFLVDLLIEDCNKDNQQKILEDIRECHKLIDNPTLPISDSLRDFVECVND